MSLPLSARHEIAEAIKHLAYDASLGRYLPASERRVYREGAGREELMDAVVGFPLYPLGDAQRWEYWLYHNVEDGLEIVFASSELQGPMGYPESPDRGRGNDLFWQAYHPGRHLDYLADVQPDHLILLFLCSLSHEHPGRLLAAIVLVVSKRLFENVSSLLAEESGTMECGTNDRNCAE